MTKIKIVVTHYAQRITTIFDYVSVKDVIINYNHLYFNLISRLSKPILPHHTPHTVWPMLNMPDTLLTQTLSYKKEHETYRLTLFR